MIKGYSHKPMGTVALGTHLGNFSKEDSLKYEAALFLIDNMGYYQGADSGELNSMYKAYEIFSTGRYT